MAAIYFNKTKQAPGPAATTPTESPIASPVGGNTVTIQNFAFNPSVLEVGVGQRVTWKQNDSAPHTVVSSDNLFASGVLNKGGEFSFVFSGAGEYSYRCGIHPGMTGKIIVK